MIVGSRSAAARQALLVAATTVLAFGCASSHPPGWSVRSSQATRAALADVVARCSGGTNVVGPGAATAGVAVGTQGFGTTKGVTHLMFTERCDVVTISDRSSTVQCAYKGGGRGWLRCNAAGDTRQVFEVGLDDACSGDLYGPAAAATLGNQACWEGAAEIEGVRYRLHRGSGLARSAATWTTEDGALLFAADLASYPPMFFASGEGRSRDLRHAPLLQAMTTGLAWVEDQRSKTRDSLDATRLRQD